MTMKVSESIVQCPVYVMHAMQHLDSAGTWCIGSVVWRVNEVTLHRVIQGWMTVFVQILYTILVCG